VGGFYLDRPRGTNSAPVETLTRLPSGSGVRSNPV